MVSVFVLFEKREGARFDRVYCRDKHVALLHEVCARHGLVNVECHFAFGPRSPLEAILILHYRDAQGARDFLADAESCRVFADVPRFTDILPRLSQMTTAFPGEEDGSGAHA